MQLEIKITENSVRPLFHSRQSERFIRIHDRRGPTRLEFEFKAKWAEGVALMLAKDDTKHWISECVGLIRDYVEFLAEPFVAVRKYGPALAPWWNEFVEGMNRFRLPVSQPITEITRMKDQRRLENLLPSLYAFRHGLAISIDDLVERAKWRITDKHEKQIEKIQKVAKGPRELG